MAILAFCYNQGILFKEDVQKSVEWFQKVAQKDDSETEPIEDGILYLFGNKEFELRLEEEEIGIIKAIVDQEVYSPEHYVNYSRNHLKYVFSQRLSYAIIWSTLTNKKLRGVILS